MNKIVGIILTMMLLISCKNSEKKDAEYHSKSENQITIAEYKKVETNNSLELEFQILGENDERIDFARLEKIAKFPGGFDSLAIFIQRNFVFPKTTDSLKIKGRVETLFSVDTIGNVVEVELKKSFLKDIDQSCLKVISKLPDWEPAELKEGKKVKTRFLLPLVFMTDENE